MTLRENILNTKAENPTFGIKRIGDLLGCAHNTVKYHLKHEKLKAYFGKANSKNRRNRLTKLKTEFGGKCSLCQYNKCLDALCFHHRNPKKKLGDVGFVLDKKGYEAAKLEALKCDLVCANCHAEIHQSLRLAKGVRSNLAESHGSAPSPIKGASDFQSEPIT